MDKLFRRGENVPEIPPESKAVAMSVQLFNNISERLATFGLESDYLQWVVRTSMEEIDDPPTGISENDAFVVIDFAMQSGHPKPYSVIQQVRNAIHETTEKHKPDEIVTEKDSIKDVAEKKSDNGELYEFYIFKARESSEF